MPGTNDQDEGGGSSHCLEDQIQRALKTIQRHESLFKRKLHEIQSMVQSVPRNQKLPGLTSKLLERELDSLIHRWNQYESSVEHFKAKFENVEAVDNVTENLEAHLDSYISIKNEVISLLQARDSTETIEQIDVAVESDESCSSSITEQTEANVNKYAKEESKSCLAKYGFMVAIGLIAIIGAYFLFYLIISFSVSRHRLEEAGWYFRYFAASINDYDMFSCCC